MRKPVLSRWVIEGLISMAAHIEAGSSADFTGYGEDAMNADQKQEWANVQRACLWIRGMQTFKRERRKR